MEPIQFRKKMRIVSGLPCIYHLGLATLYSEQVKEDGDSYIFDPEKTVYLVFDRPNAEGKQAFAYGKGFGPGIPMLPTFLRAGKAAVFISDCTDENIINICRHVLSGLVIPPKGMKLPPAPPGAN